MDVAPDAGDDTAFNINDGAIDNASDQDAIDGAGLPDAPGPGQDAGREVDGETGCGPCALGVLYWCEGTSANTIRATFSLVNDTEAPIPLHEVTIRYWFTGGAGASPWEFACDLGIVGVQTPPPERKDVTGGVTNVFRKVPARPGADMYFEVQFTAAAGDLPPGYYSLFRTRVYRTDFTNITQTDDYSYNAKNITFGSSPHITLYRNGQLLSGVEPPLR